MAYKKTGKKVENRDTIDNEPIPRRTLPVFFIVDTSGSMQGTRIGAVNSAIDEVLNKLKEINADNADAEIEVAFLTFSNEAEWLTSSGPMKVDTYKWFGLNADGLTNMGDAFKALNEKLNEESGFLSRASGSYAPMLFLMTDGEPNSEYEIQLDKLKKNAWFHFSTKIALAIGDEANDTVLQKFTGTKEGVVRVPDGENAGKKLAKMVVFLTITTTMVVKYSTVTSSAKINTDGSSGSIKEKEVHEAIQSGVGEILDDDFNVEDSLGGEEGLNFNG